jgi:hypothetical protein
VEKRILEAEPALEVYITSAGKICIRQSYPDQHEDEHQSIIISHERVPILLQWLQETLEERKRMSDSEFEE